MSEQLNAEPVPPRPGEVWRHYKGGLYEVVCVATREESGLLVVVYRGATDPTRTWVRDLWQWQERVNHEGKFVRRYERTEDGKE